MRKTSARGLSLTAMFVAGAVVTMYLSSIVPNMRLALTAMAGLFTVTAVIEGGIVSGALCFAAVTVLGALVVPDKVNVILYASFFGYYPLVKSLAERRGNQLTGWIIKGAVALVVITVYLFGLRHLLLPHMDGHMTQFIPVVYLAGAALFVIYDLGLSKLIGFYLARIYKHRNGR